MPDRVRFLGYSNLGEAAPVYHVAGIGYNGQAHPATLDPPVRDIAGAVKQWHRVQTWALSTDAQAVAGPDTENLTNGDLVSVPTGGTVAEVLRELDLVYVLADSFGEPWLRAWNIPGTGTGICALYLGDAVSIDGNDRYPVIEVTGQIAANDGTGGNGAVLYFDKYESQLPAAATGSITATLDGINFELFYYIATSGDGSASISYLDITPAAYFPYADKDGNPIYDTITGAQLQDPRN